VSLAPEFGGLSAKDMFLTRGTPFDTLALRQVEQELAAHGFQMRGKETMFNGITGKMLPAKVFIGPVYYQRLKHMVVDKIHARARGSHTSITRQPKEGRQFGGGFRIGYMERDNLAGQGAAAFLRDRLLENSDDYTMWFCSLCGVQAVMSRKGHGECTLCKSRDVRKVRLPYATKLLMQELQGMGIMTRVVTTTFDHNSPKIEAVGKI
jgi:DNA-directed RNA polymerase II subunit RPB2